MALLCELSMYDGNIAIHAHQNILLNYTFVAVIYFMESELRCCIILPSYLLVGYSDPSAQDRADRRTFQL